MAASTQRSGKDQNEIAEWLKQRTTQNTQQGEECLKINYHGTKNVTEALLPLVRSSADGRIVNVTSAFGLLRVRALPATITDPHHTQLVTTRTEMKS